MSAKEIFSLLGYDVITLLSITAVVLILLLRRFLPGKRRKEIDALLSAVCAVLPVPAEDLLLRLEKALLRLALRGKACDAAETVRRVLKEHSSLTEEEIAVAVAAVRAIAACKKPKRKK